MIFRLQLPASALVQTSAQEILHVYLVIHFLDSVSDFLL